MSAPITTSQAATAFRPDITTFEPTTVIDQAAILKWFDRRLQPHSR